MPDKAIVLEGDRLITRPDGGPDSSRDRRWSRAAASAAASASTSALVEGTSAIVIVPTDPDIAGGGAPAVG